MEDCYYFLYSKCTKSPCQYRHSLTAKENPILCKTWKNKQTCKKDCPFRHSTYHLNKKRHEMECFYQDECQKEFCEFKHKNKEKDAWKESRVKSLNEIVGRKSKTDDNIIKNEEVTEQSNNQTANISETVNTTSKTDNEAIYDFNGQEVYNKPSVIHQIDKLNGQGKSFDHSIVKIEYSQIFSDDSHFADQTDVIIKNLKKRKLDDTGVKRYKWKEKISLLEKKLEEKPSLIKISKEYIDNLQIEDNDLSFKDNNFEK